MRDSHFNGDERSARSGSWVSVTILRGAILRLNRAYEALAADERAAWWRAMGLGLVAVLVLTAGLVWGTRTLAGAGLLRWEEPMLRWIIRELPVSFSTAMWLEGVGNGFVLWAVALYAAAMSARAGRPLQTLAFLLGHTLVYAPIAMGWWLWNRERPAFLLDGLAHPGGVFHAFPSGHMVQSSFAFGLLLWLWLRSASARGERIFAWSCYLVLIALVGFGRLRIGVHWPSDILAGSLIGGGWAMAVVRATR